MIRNRRRAEQEKLETCSGHMSWWQGSYLHLTLLNEPDRQRDAANAMLGPHSQESSTMLGGRTMHESAMVVMMSVKDLFAIADMITETPEKQVVVKAFSWSASLTLGTQSK